MLIYFVALFVLLWLAAFVLGFAYRARLRAVAPEIAARFVPWHNAAKGLESARFLISGGFRAIHNPGFVRFCEVYRAVVIGMWLLLVFVPLAFVSHA